MKRMGAEQWEPQFMPKRLEVAITMEKFELSVSDPSDSPSIELHVATPESIKEQGELTMEWVRSVGHTQCNPACNPPFGHTSQEAYIEVAKYIRETDNNR